MAKTEFMTQTSLQFKVIQQEGKARAGVMQTAHGQIETPVFMPVGTAGTVKAVHQHELRNDIKAQLILGNTYHLFLRPKLDVLREAGGLHRFIGWDRPMLTDSGGYQVFSLANNRKISEDGVVFASHLDGSKQVLNPEIAMDVQRTIGADIIMAFDECPPYPSDYNYTRKSMELTHRWLQRCITQFNSTQPHYGYPQFLFPIVQGGTYPELRKKSAEFIAGLGLEGNAIGGLSVGEPEADMYAMAELVCDILPADKPRYLMGVGTPANLIENIGLGIDMFDCVLPTRNARHGVLYTLDGIINIKNEKWRKDFSPLDGTGTSAVDQLYSKAYLRHLIHSGEILGAQIASIHNLAFFVNLVNTARQHILAGTFYDWKARILPKLRQRL